MEKTIDELQKEFNDYKTAQEETLKARDSEIAKLKESNQKLEVEVATLNDLRLSQNTGGKKSKSLLEDFE